LFVNQLNVNICFRRSGNSVIYFHQDATISYPSWSNSKLMVMKKRTWVPVLGLIMSIIGFQCTKNNSSTIGPAQLNTSLSSVKENEPLIVSSNETGENLYVNWSVSPSAGTWLSPSGNKTVILFSIPGNYVVKARYYLDSAAITPYDSSTTPVTVTDSAYNDTSGLNAICNVIEAVSILPGDLITIEPVSYTDSGLVFVAHTALTYGNNYPRLDIIFSSDTLNNPGSGAISTYEYNVANVLIAPCTSQTPLAMPATGYFCIKGLSIGTYDLRFALNGTLYQGSMIVSESGCTFSWSYSSGIIFSPVSITKN
jgi:hypothetical protein